MFEKVLAEFESALEREATDWEKSVISFTVTTTLMEGRK